MTRVPIRRNRGRSRRRLLPRPRILLGTLLISVFLGVLVLQAYINAEFTGDHVESEVGLDMIEPRAIAQERDTTAFVLQRLQP